MKASVTGISKIEFYGGAAREMRFVEQRRC